MDLRSELELATQLARAAAAAILDVRGEALKAVRTKRDASPVTEADLAADAVIRSGLRATGAPVVSEESWGEGAMPDKGRVWVVDPLDGTSDFVRGRGDYVVQIGLVVDGRPRVGVVMQPETGILWRGLVNEHESSCERLAPDSARTTLSLQTSGTLIGPPRIAASISHPSAFVDFVVGDLGGVVVPRGSVGLKAALVIEGLADAYLTGSRRIKVWDTAAPAALILAAGGDVCDLSQRALTYGGPLSHGDGICMWSLPARTTLRAPLAQAIARYGTSESHT